jgi:hypothetical protein
MNKTVIKKHRTNLKQLEDDIVNSFNILTKNKKIDFLSNLDENISNTFSEQIKINLAKYFDILDELPSMEIYNNFMGDTLMHSVLSIENNIIRIYNNLSSTITECTFDKIYTLDYKIDLLNEIINYKEI